MSIFVANKVYLILITCVLVKV